MQYDNNKINTFSNVNGSNTRQLVRFNCNRFMCKIILQVPKFFCHIVFSAAGVHQNTKSCTTLDLQKRI